MHSQCHNTKAKSIQTFITSYLYDNELHKNTCFFPPNCIHRHFLPIIRPSHLSKLPKPSSVVCLVRFLSVTVGKSLNMRPYRCSVSQLLLKVRLRSFLDALFPLPLICISCWDTGWNSNTGTSEQMHGDGKSLITHSLLGPGH